VLAERFCWHGGAHAAHKKLKVQKSVSVTIIQSICAPRAHCVFLQGQFMISNNAFKSALTARKPQIGLWLSMADAYLAEVSATAAFDWLLIDGEHAPNDVRSTLAQLQVLAAYPAHAVVRAVQGDVALVKQLLDIGAQTLLIPMIDTAEQARAMVLAVRYPPRGVRGVGSAVGRASRWNGRSNYMEVADSEICLLVQAESVLALKNLEAICAVDGVDGVFIGPADLAASMGHPSNPAHPDVQAAIEKAIVSIVSSGKAAGTLTSDNKLARRYLELGCTFVAVGVDVLVYANSARQLANTFRKDDIAHSTLDSAGAAY
jgi:4-hydroxy-2-oxoheptanedioate aldolase